MTDSALGPKTRLSEGWRPRPNLSQFLFKKGTYPKTKTPKKTRRSDPRSTHAVPCLVNQPVGRAQQSVIPSHATNQGSSRFTMVRFPEINKGPVEPDFAFLLDILGLACRLLVLASAPGLSVPRGSRTGLQAGSPEHLLPTRPISNHTHG
jgi:hypothetical protein